MEEIKVGDYIRTIDGYIRKVEQVNRKGSYDGLCHGAYNVDIPYKYSQGISAKKIKSHSSNLIDLIEVGDYVNGKEVFINAKEYLIFKDVGSTVYSESISPENIKSIVTKEQYESIKYEV